MTPDLALTGSIPGLLRWCSPVTLPSGDRDGPYRSVVLYFAESGEYATASRTAGPWVFYEPDALTLDLTDPTGRFHALLWLREHGHDLAWAMEEPEVLAWSVLSVARGGGPIQATLPPWKECGGDEWIRSTRRDELWVQRGMTAGWTLRRFNKNPINGPETGPEGRALADAAALKANYALRNADGITLPELPGER